MKFHQFCLPNSSQIHLFFSNTAITQVQATVTSPSIAVASSLFSLAPGLPQPLCLIFILLGKDNFESFLKFHLMSLPLENLPD